MKDHAQEQSKTMHLAKQTCTQVMLHSGLRKRRHTGRYQLLPNTCSAHFARVVPGLLGLLAGVLSWLSVSSSWSSSPSSCWQEACSLAAAWPSVPVTVPSASGRMWSSCASPEPDAFVALVNGGCDWSPWSACMRYTTANMSGM
jgi:hypothetical protein